MTRPVAYGVYREGFPWAPRIPMHWNHASLRWLAKIYAGGTPDKENLDYWSDGTIPWLNSGSVNDWNIVSPSAFITEEALARSSARWVPEGAVVIGLAGQGKTKGTSARVGVAATCNQSMAAIVPGPSLNFRFLHFWLVSNYQSIRNLAGGDKRDGLNLQHIGSIETPLPPPDEQRVIADYLDRETAQIDTLISKQERLIETLRERRAAVVEAAFLATPGLARTRVRNLLGQRPSYGVLVPTYEDDGVPFVRVGDLGRLHPAMSLPRIPETQSAEFSRTRLQGGEILLGVVGNMGKSVVAPEWLAGANVARAVAVLRCRADVDAALLNRWFETRRFRDQAMLATGSDTAQPTLGMKDLAGFLLLWPSRSEDASRLASHLDEETTKIDALIAKAERFIEVSKERRSALITAAVTGQIDVRENVASTRAQELVR